MSKGILTVFVEVEKKNSWVHAMVTIAALECVVLKSATFYKVETFVV